MPPELVIIYDLAAELILTEGQIITQQYARAEYFYLLRSGKVSFSLMLEGEGQELLVGKSDQADTPMGWSGFNQPNRYSTTIRVASKQATVYRWKWSDLKSFLEDHPDQAMNFMKLVSSKSRNLIKEAITLLGEFAPTLPQQEAYNSEEFIKTSRAQEEDVVGFLRRSPFFEVFEEYPLAQIAQKIQRRQYRAQDIIYEQGSTAKGIYLLSVGKVRFSSIDDREQLISFRQINSPGFVVGWSGAIGLPNLITAHAVQESVVYFIPQSVINKLSENDQQFGLDFYQRLLWLLGHQLQAIRARLIAAKFNHEIIAISNLIEQNSTRLELHSPLHKIPHLLDNKLTISDGIRLLDEIKSIGNTLEKNISSMSLDMLQEIKKEQKFYQGLVKVYETVVKAPDQLTTQEVRRQSAEAFGKTMEDVNYVIEGQENLPTEPGHIFIYNHLRNHPYNTLPNQFQLTLDSHFISSMILYHQYGDPGIRIVRIGRGAEYAHQEYYQRLGHIDVFTSESDHVQEASTDRDSKRKLFFEQASSHLEAGRNLIISPEGTSYSTDESPGPFKSGAFRLALSLRREPLIVPIAMANFDRRIRNNRFSSVILPAFKASDYISDPNDKEAMRSFLNHYQETFRQHVQKAIGRGKNSLKIHTND